MGKCASHQEVNGPSIRFCKDSQERGLLRGGNKETLHCLEIFGQCDQSDKQRQLVVMSMYQKMEK